MRNRIQVIAPGSKVRLTELIYGIVKQVNFSAAQVIYEVSWVESGHYHTAWMNEFEFYQEEKTGGTTIVSFIER